MFWTGFDVDTNLNLLARAYLDVEHASVIDQVEMDHPVRFLWVTARRSVVPRPAG